MTSPTTLGVGHALNRMGMKGGELPEVARSRWPSVLVMGQLNTLIAEPFEPRAISGGVISGALFCSFEIHCRAPGGLVIEHLAIDPATTVATVRLAITDAPQLAGANPGKLDVGGIDTRSDVLEESRAGPLAAGISLRGSDTFAMWERIYLRPGKYFSASVETASVGLAYALEWREVESPQGTP
jgi:hypothetical protein